MNPNQIFWLQIVDCVSSSLSALGCCFVLFCYFKFKSIRTYASRLLVYLTCSSFLYSTANIIGAISDENHTVCSIEGFLREYSMIGILYWSTCIACIMFVSLYGSDIDDLELKRRKAEIPLLILGILIPIPLSIL